MSVLQDSEKQFLDSGRGFCWQSHKGSAQNHQATTGKPLHTELWWCSSYSCTPMPTCSRAKILFLVSLHYRSTLLLRARGCCKFIHQTNSQHQFPALQQFVLVVSLLDVLVTVEQPSAFFYFFPQPALIQYLWFLLSNITRLTMRYKCWKLSFFFFKGNLQMILLFPVTVWSLMTNFLQKFQESNCNVTGLIFYMSGKKQFCESWCSQFPSCAALALLNF